MIVVGLMSGTSADGVDAVLVKFIGSPSSPQWRLLNFVSVKYPDPLRKKIVRAGQGQSLSSSEFVELIELVTEWQANAARNCDPKGQSTLVGCHGQTLWHKPPRTKQRGASLQLLNAPLLAQLLGRPVVHNFRAADMALGGQGAPLVPKPLATLLGRVRGWRALLNLGGIANLTIIPPCIGPDKSSSLLGWDSGPANSLLDLAIDKQTKGQLSFDHNGEIAAKGEPDFHLINNWLQEPYFIEMPPKSTGRDQFGVVDLDRRLKESSSLSFEDLIATLTSFTAEIVAQDLERFFERTLIKPIELIVSGGGAYNSAMLQALRSSCTGMRISTIQRYGIRPQSLEPLAFALLAWWHIHKVSGNSPAITGALHEAILGVRADSN